MGGSGNVFERQVVDIAHCDNSAVFLFKEYPTLFEAQFKGLHTAPDFHSWVQHRTYAIVGSRSEKHLDLEHLADIALSLPMPIANRNLLMDSGARRAELLRKLEDDRWIEQYEDQLIPAHDVLTDALASNWLFGTPGSATTRVADALRRAAGAGYLERALDVLGRLATHPNFGDMDAVEVIRRVITAHPQQVANSARAILSGRLLDHQAKIRVMSDHTALRNAVAEDRTLDASLSSIAEFAAQLPPDNPLRGLAAVLEPLLDLAVAHPHPSNMVLRRADRDGGRLILVRAINVSGIVD